MSRPTLLAPRVVAAIGAVFWGWLFFGLQDTATVFVGGQDFAAHYLVESGWGLLFLGLVAIPLIGLVLRPRSGVLVGQVAAVGVAVLLGALLAGSAAHLVPGVGVLVTALAVGGAARLEVHPGRVQADWPLVVCVGLAVVPAVGYSRRMATATADVETTWNLDHYPIQAALGIAVVLVGAVIAVANGSSGTRLATATLVVTVAWIGVESVVFPHRVGSLGPAWGWVSTGWAITFLVLALRSGVPPARPRRSPPDLTPRPVQS